MDFQFASGSTSWLMPLCLALVYVHTNEHEHAAWNTLMSSSPCNNTFLSSHQPLSPIQHSSFHLFLLFLLRPRNVCRRIYAVMSRRYSTYLRDVSRVQMSHQGISIGLKILRWFSRTSRKCPRSYLLRVDGNRERMSETAKQGVFWCRWILMDRVFAQPLVIDIYDGIVSLSWC